jgi:hypothetical protein
MGKTTAKNAGKPKRVYPAVTKFYKDQAGEWRWQIKKGRNIIDASTEGYINCIDCKESYFNSALEKVRLFTRVFIGDEANNAIKEMEGWKAQFITSKQNIYKFTA